MREEGLVVLEILNHLVSTGGDPTAASAVFKEEKFIFLAERGDDPA